jgi:hypothetical protein
MTTKAAKDNFEKGLKTAEANNDAAMEFLFAGLLELTKAVADMKGTVENIKNDQR